MNRQHQLEAYALTPDGQRMVECPTCCGLGQIEVRSVAQYGPDASVEDCKDCDGWGECAHWWFLSLTRQRPPVGVR